MHSSLGMLIWRRLRWLLHPITVFVLLQIIWLVLTVLWVVWFFDRYDQLSAMARSLGESAHGNLSILALVVGCVLLLLILAGTVLLFVFGIKQVSMNRQQRQFISSVTHELKSPLASLGLTIETLARKEWDPATRQQMIHMMSIDTQRLERLVNQVLLSARIDLGFFLSERRSLVNFKPWLNDIAQQLEYRDPKMRERLRVQADIPEQILIPQSALALALGNILENAMKYSPSGSPIEVSAAIKKGFLEISVHDYGIGIDRKERRKVFKMFHRGSNAIKNAIPGTGLGLYIVRQTLKTLGGNITIDTEDKRAGTTFCLKVPHTEA